MTRKEFEIYRISITKEQCPRNVSDPIEYGIQRAVFRKEQLIKLIGLGKRIQSRTVQAKVTRWKRQIEKLTRSQAHLVSLKHDIDATRLQLPVFSENSMEKPSLTGKTSCGRIP